MSEIPELKYGTWEVIRRGSDVALLATGTMVLSACEASERLAAQGIQAEVVNCRFLKPYDQALLREVMARHARIVTIEEGAVVNGFGAFLSREISALHLGQDTQVKCLGLPDRFIGHGTRQTLLHEVGLDAEGIATEVRRVLGDAVSAAVESA